MAAHCEQIGQRTGHEEAMRVLLQTAIAHLGKAEHPLDDPDHMFNPGPHFGLGAVFRPLDLIDNTAVAVAAIGEIAGLGRALPDYRPRAAVSLITPYPGLIAVQQIGQHRAVRHWPASAPPHGSAWFGCRPRNAPSSRNTTGCPSSSGASRDRAPCRHSWSTTAH